MTNEATDRALSALKSASEAFHRYAKHHAGKSPPDAEKAEANTELARQMDEAIAALSTPARPVRRFKVANWRSGGMATIYENGVNLGTVKCDFAREIVAALGGELVEGDSDA